MAWDAKPIAHLITLVKAYRSNCLRATAEDGELRRRVGDMDGKTREAASSAEQLKAKSTSMNGEWYTLAATWQVLALEVQCMPGLAEEVKSLRPGVMESQEVYRTKASKAQAKQRTADMEVVAEQVCTEHADIRLGLRS